MSLRAKAGWIICVLMLGQARGVAGQNIEPLMWDIAGFARATHYRARSGLESWDWGGGARVSMRAGTLPIMLQAGYSFGYADFEEPLLHRRRAKHAMIDVAAVALLIPPSQEVDGRNKPDVAMGFGVQWDEFNVVVPDRIEDATNPFIVISVGMPLLEIRGKRIGRFYASAFLIDSENHKYRFEFGYGPALLCSRCGSARVVGGSEAGR